MRGINCSPSYSIGSCIPRKRMQRTRRLSNQKRRKPSRVAWTRTTSLIRILKRRKTMTSISMTGMGSAVRAKRNVAMTMTMMMTSLAGV